MNNLNLTDTNVLLFDLGNVLINIHNEKQWWQNTFLPNFDIEAIEELESINFFNLYDLGEIPSDLFIDILKSISLKKLSDGEIIQIWNSKILDLPPSRVKLLEKLKKTHPIYLLSNTNEIHIDFIDDYVMRTFGFPVFKDLFDACIYSHEICMKKPSKEIYALSHKVIGDVPASSILFFDDLKRNIKGAKAYGFQAFEVKNDISDFLK